MAMPMPPSPRGAGPQPSMMQAPQPGAQGLMDTEMQPAGMGPDVGQLKQQFLAQLRQLIQQIDALSSTFPAFAPFADQIMQAAQEGMVQVVAALGAQELPQTPMGIA